jgi:hypothetical protein
VQQQISTKRIGDHQRINAPKVFAYIVCNTRHLIAEIPVRKVAPRLAACDTKPSIQQRLAKASTQMSTTTWQVINGGLGVIWHCVWLKLPKFTGRLRFSAGAERMNDTNIGFLRIQTPFKCMQGNH